MPFLFAVRRQKNTHNVERGVGVEHFGAHRQHVGIVVLAGVVCHFGVVAVGGADTGNFVGCHRGANARTVDENPARRNRRRRVFATA